MSRERESWKMLLLALAITPWTAMLSGWALSLTWGWFIVPTFGLPPLRIPVAIGVAAVISYLTKNGNPEEPISSQISTAIIRPPLFLLFCWIVRWFV